MSTTIKQDGERLSIGFADYDIEAYRMFLRAKRLPEYQVDFDRDTQQYSIITSPRFAHMLGLSIGRSEREGPQLSSRLMEDQRWIVGTALDAKRYACWSDCGLGKTLIGLEFARHVQHRTGKRVLIVTLNDVVDGWLAQAAEHYTGTLELARLQSRAEMREWCERGTIDGVPTDAQIAVTNFEKFNHRDPADQIVSEVKSLGGVVLDESSRLKTGGGKQKWALIKSCRGVEYKLSLTATPAPNELMEFASQASFLEKMRSQSLQDAAQQIIWTYFTRDPKTHRWTIKQHARAAFFEWMSSWSIYIRDPRRFGWRLNVPQPPEPEYFVHELPMTDAQRGLVMEINADPTMVPEKVAGSMFVGELNAIAVNRLSQAAKGFRYHRKTQDGTRKARAIQSEKPAFVADLIRREVAINGGTSVLVWTVYDEETRILARLLKGSEFGVETLTGEVKEQEERRGILDRFKSGETRVLITRAKMLGYGQNLQHVGSMVFSGWTFSYEEFYQAIRRAYRHGQTRRVRVHLPVIPELEGQMYDALLRKQRQHEEAVAEMESNYIKVISAAAAA